MQVNTDGLDRPASSTGKGNSYFDAKIEIETRSKYVA